MASVNNRQIRRAAQIAGIPPWLLSGLVRQESGGRQGAVSSAGASGVAQLMPGTASYESRKHGLNTATPFGNLMAGAFYLREKYNEFKRWDYALAAYNAGSGAVHKYGGIPPYKETRNYVRSIMQGRTATLPVAGGLGGIGPPVAPGANLRSVAVPGVTPPAFTQKDAAMEGLSALAQGKYDPTVGLGELQKAAKATAAAVAASTYSKGFAGAEAGAQQLAPYPVAAKGGWRKFVIMAPGADRAGVRTKGFVLQFVGALGRRAGERLTIGTGTNHDEMTVNGRVSQHWSGHAADVKAEGANLTRLGRLALMQAGMSRKEALRARGGIYNIGRYQIIFNTTEGGNHWNHLHIGIR